MSSLTKIPVIVNFKSLKQSLQGAIELALQYIDWSFQNKQDDNPHWTLSLGPFEGRQFVMERNNDIFDLRMTKDSKDLTVYDFYNEKRLAGDGSFVEYLLHVKEIYEFYRSYDYLSYNVPEIRIVFNLR